MSPLLLSLLGSACVSSETPPAAEEAAAGAAAAPEVSVTVEPWDQAEDLIPACREGSGEACFNLGVQALDGAPPDAFAAWDFFQRSCRLEIERGCRNAELLLRSEDYGETALLQRACELSSAEACWALGSQARERSELVTAEPLLQQACELKWGVACTELGALFLAVIPARPEDALIWFKRGCARGDGAGCMNAARAYHLGEGIAPDEQVSQQYLTDACKRGFPPACERLKDSAP